MWPFRSGVLTKVQATTTATCPRCTSTWWPRFSSERLRWLVIIERAVHCLHWMAGCLFCSASSTTTTTSTSSSSLTGSAMVVVCATTGAGAAVVLVGATVVHWSSMHPLCAHTLGVGCRLRNMVALDLSLSLFRHTGSLSPWQMATFEERTTLWRSTPRQPRLFRCVVAVQGAVRASFIWLLLSSFAADSCEKCGKPTALLKGSPPRGLRPLSFSLSLTFSALHSIRQRRSSWRCAIAIAFPFAFIFFFSSSSSRVIVLPLLMLMLQLRASATCPLPCVTSISTCTVVHPPQSTWNIPHFLSPFAVNFSSAVLAV